MVTSQLVTGAWSVLGDFNAFLKAQDRIGGIKYKTQKLDSFHIVFLNVNSLKCEVVTTTFHGQT